MEVSLSDFEKLDIRIGRVINAERIPGSRKLVKIEVDLGEPLSPHLDHEDLGVLDDELLAVEPEDDFFDALHRLHVQAHPLQGLESPPRGHLYRIALLRI